MYAVVSLHNPNPMPKMAAIELPHVPGNAYMARRKKKNNSKKAVDEDEDEGVKDRDTVYVKGSNTAEEKPKKSPRTQETGRQAAGREEQGGRPEKRHPRL